jgi:hypothetical protein
MSDSKPPSTGGRIAPLVKGRFTWDASDSIFEGWHNPSHRWNGWATPAFEKAEADRLMTWQMAQEGTGQPDGLSAITYDPVKDVYVIDYRNQYPDEGDDALEEIEPFFADCGGQQLKLYAIGSYFWTWYEA